MRQQTVHELRVAFRYNVEEVRKHDVGKIFRAFDRWAKPGMSGNAMMTFLVITAETSTELLNRLRPTLEQISSIDNFWCSPAPANMVGRYGLDPFRHWLDAAWKQAREWNETEHMRNRKGFGSSKRRV